MTATIRKEYKFEAAHQLDHHKGKCRHLHGHSYKVELFVNGTICEEPSASDEGMVVDFGEMNEAWRPIFDLLDHSFLNDVLPVRTTAENIAAWICTRLWEMGGFIISRVRVWETAKAYAEVGVDDIPPGFPWKTLQELDRNDPV